MLDFWMAGRLVVGQGVLVRGFFAFFRNEVTNFCNEVTTWCYFWGYSGGEVTTLRYSGWWISNFALLL